MLVSTQQGRVLYRANNLPRLVQDSLGIVDVIIFWCPQSHAYTYQSWHLVQGKVNTVDDRDYLYC